MDMAILHPFHSQKINKGTPHPIPSGIFRNPELPGVVGNGYFNDPKSFHLHQGWHEAVHPLIHFEILETLPPVDPEGAAAVPNRFATETVPDVVGYL